MTKALNKALFYLNKSYIPKKTCDGLIIGFYCIVAGEYQFQLLFSSRNYNFNSLKIISSCCFPKI